MMARLNSAGLAPDRVVPRAGNNQQSSIREIMGETAAKLRRYYPIVLSPDHQRRDRDRGEIRPGHGHEEYAVGRRSSRIRSRTLSRGPIRSLPHAAANRREP